MKHTIFFFTFLCIFSCKKKTPEKSPVLTSPVIETAETSDSLAIKTQEVFSEKDMNSQKEKLRSLKKQHLFNIKDDKLSLQKMLLSKAFFKETDQYILDYKYPYLHEKEHPSFSIFNKRIERNYLNISKVENEILENKNRSCDSLLPSTSKDKRILDYKAYFSKNNTISILVYKENYYAGAANSSYMFECLNFDTDNAAFITHGDFFKKDTDKELFTTINKTIKETISSGEMYYDCWSLSEGDFDLYKNNFIIAEDSILFYFDDCVICPSYTGTYSITIPIQKIAHLITPSFSSLL